MPLGPGTPEEFADSIYRAVELLRQHVREYSELLPVSNQLTPARLIVNIGEQAAPLASSA